MGKTLSKRLSVGGFISAVIILIAGLACTPIVVDQVQGMNTTDWSFTGYSGAIALKDLIPFVWIGALVTGVVVLILGKATGKM